MQKQTLSQSNRTLKQNTVALGSARELISTQFLKICWGTNIRLRLPKIEALGFMVLVTTN